HSIHVHIPRCPQRDHRSPRRRRVAGIRQSHTPARGRGGIRHLHHHHPRSAGDDDRAHQERSSALSCSAPRSTTSTKEPPCPSSDRKSTRLNSSHVSISYAVFCLKKKNLRDDCCLIL